MDSIAEGPKWFPRVAHHDLQKGSKLPQKMERLILEKGQNETTTANMWVRENDQNLLQVKQVHNFCVNDVMRSI